MTTRAAAFSQGAKVESALTWVVSAESRIGTFGRACG
jgi:hypothetical protein